MAGGKPQLGEGLGNLVKLAPTLSSMAFGYDPLTGHRSGGAVGSLTSLARQTPVGSLVMGKKPWIEKVGKMIFGNEFPQHLSSSTGSDGGGIVPVLTPKQLRQLRISP